MNEEASQLLANIDKTIERTPGVEVLSSRFRTGFQMEGEARLILDGSATWHLNVGGKEGLLIWQPTDL